MALPDSAQSLRRSCLLIALKETERKKVSVSPYFYLSVCLSLPLSLSLCLLMGQSLIRPDNGCTSSADLATLICLLESGMKWNQEISLELLFKGLLQEICALMLAYFSIINFVE